MRDRSRMHGPARQHGAVLLIMLALITVLFMYGVVAGLNRSASDMAQERAKKTAVALAQAKEALIAYAVTYKDTHDNPAGGTYTVPGFLPCPDMGPGTNPEGQAAPNCGSFLVSQIGRLPWKTLGLSPLRDGSGDCLWYAVSGTYKNNPNGVTNNNATATSTTTNNLMNWDTNGQFTILDSSGNTLAGSPADPSTNAVAVIFAPGAPIAGQDRTPVAGTSNCGGNFNAVPPAAAYLESANGIDNSTLVTPSSPASVTDVSTFIAGNSGPTFNDQLVYITRADIWNSVKKRSDLIKNLHALTRRAAECTAMYGSMNSAGANDKRLPWAGNVNMAYLSYYAVNRRYVDVVPGFLNTPMSGRLSYRVRNSVPATSNTLTANSDLTLGSYSSFLLLSSLNALPSGSYCAYTAEEKIWYDNWKDHLFYALSNRYSPSFGATTGTCGFTNTCLKISNAANTQTYTYYAAFVIFAGEKLSGQSRSTLSDKSSISNYLEGRNAGNHPNSSGNATYQGSGISSAFNDVVYAINETLGVSCYVPDPSGTTGSMVGAPSASCP